MEMEEISTADSGSYWSNSGVTPSDSLASLEEYH